MVILAIAVAVSAASAADRNPRDHRRYSVLAAAFASMLKKPRPLEERCTAISGATGNDALDAILRPYLDRQAALPDGARRYPIVDCRYTAKNHGREGRVIMMNPPADQLAAWIVSACTKPGARRAELTEEACLLKVARMIWLQTSAQFPITGYVPEPAAVCPGSPKGATRALFGYRDGVAAALAGTPHETGNTPNNPCGAEAKIAATCTTVAIPSAQLDAALSARVTKLPRPAYARLGNVPMKMMMPVSAETRCPAPEGPPFVWLETARASYLAALGSDSYSMLERYVGMRDDDERFTCKDFGDDKLFGPCE